MYLSSNATAVTESARAEDRVWVHKVTQDGDSSRWREVQSTAKSFANAWEPTKGLVQSLLEQGVHGLSVAKVKELQEVSNHIIYDSPTKYNSRTSLGCDRN